MKEVFQRYLDDDDYKKAVTLPVNHGSLQFLHDCHYEGIIKPVIDWEIDFIKSHQPNLYKVAVQLAVLLGRNDFNETPSFDLIDESFEDNPSGVASIDVTSPDKAAGFIFDKEFLPINEADFVNGALKDLLVGFAIGNMVAHNRYSPNPEKARKYIDVSDDIVKTLNYPSQAEHAFSSIGMALEDENQKLMEAIEWGVDLDFIEQKQEDRAKIGAIVCYNLIIFEKEQERINAQIDDAWKNHQQQSPGINWFKIARDYFLKKRNTTNFEEDRSQIV